MQDAEDIDYRNKFPGYPQTKGFMAIVSGKIRIVDPGPYKFCLNSSDGAKVIQKHGVFRQA